MDAFGSDVLSVDDFDGEFSAGFRANFAFTVDAGSASGTWSSSGTNVLDGEVNVGEGTITVMSERSVSGSGELAGDRLELAITGTTTERGEMTMAGAGFDRVIPIDNSGNPDAMPPGTITITDWHCEWATGEWLSTTQASLDQFGSYVLPMRGIFSALRTDLFENLSEGEAFDRVDGLRDLGVDFNAFVDDLNADTDTFTQITGLLTRAESVLNELTNLSECDVRLLGLDHVERWKNMLTRAIGDLIFRAADRFNLSVDQLQDLLFAGLRTGAVGGGAADTATAARAEEAVRQKMEDILIENFHSEDCPSGSDRCIDLTNETLNAMTTAEFMNWEYTIDDVSVDPGEFLANLADEGYSWEVIE